MGTPARTSRARRPHHSQPYFLAFFFAADFLAFAGAFFAAVFFVALGIVFTFPMSAAGTTTIGASTNTTIINRFFCRRRRGNDHFLHEVASKRPRGWIAACRKGNARAFRSAPQHALREHKNIDKHSVKRARARSFGPCARAMVTAPRVELASRATTLTCAIRRDDLGVQMSVH